MREPAWRQEGVQPDYRFSLANERTFLAWIRTSLALLAGAVAVDQLAPSLAVTPVRIAICLILAGVGTVLAVLAYRRWKAQEDAMRHRRPLPHSAVLWGMSVLVAVAALVADLLVLRSWFHAQAQGSQALRLGLAAVAVLLLTAGLGAIAFRRRVALLRYGHHTVACTALLALTAACVIGFALSCAVAIALR